MCQCFSVLNGAFPAYSVPDTLRGRKGEIALMRKKDCVALIDISHQGGLGLLSRDFIQAMVHYGGRYRLIDFVLSNCCRSQLDIVGILTQWNPVPFHEYISTGASWGFDRLGAKLEILPSMAKPEQEKCCRSTLEAIRENIPFLEHYHPHTVLLLQAERVYFMDYRGLLAFHQKNRADVTLGVVSTDGSSLDCPAVTVGEQGRITAIGDPAVKSRTRAMGAAVIDWKLLRKYLLQSNPVETSDFYTDFLASLLRSREATILASPFHGYWRAVTGVESLWQGQMDLLSAQSGISVAEFQTKLFTNASTSRPPQYLYPSNYLQNSLVAEGCSISGSVRNSILFPGVTVGEDAVVGDSILMPGCIVQPGAQVFHSILGQEVTISPGCRIGDAFYNDKINVIRSGAVVLNHPAVQQGKGYPVYSQG